MSQSILVLFSLESFSSFWFYFPWNHSVHSEFIFLGIIQFILVLFPWNESVHSDFIFLRIIQFILSLFSLESFSSFLGIIQPFLVSLQIEFRINLGQMEFCKLYCYHMKGLDRFLLNSILMLYLRFQTALSYVVYVVSAKTQGKIRSVLQL